MQRIEHDCSNTSWAISVGECEILVCHNQLCVNIFLKSARNDDDDDDDDGDDDGDDDVVL